MGRGIVLRLATIALLVLFPLTWFAPLMRAGLLPLFGLSEISVITGLQALWGTDPALALLVSFFALFAPMAKLIGLALVQARLASPRLGRRCTSWAVWRWPMCFWWRCIS